MEPWRRLDLAAPGDAGELLRRCCGASRWVEGMLLRRPFGSREAMLAAANAEWFALGADDWREAFSHHPEIGGRDALRRRFDTTRHLSGREQDGVTGAREDVLAALADLNQAYRDRFGYIFIVCATGKSAMEMLELLRARLEHDPTEEIRVAAGEQAKITELRLLAVE